MKITDFRLGNYVLGHDGEIHSIEELNFITEFVRTNRIIGHSISSYTGALLPEPIKISELINNFGLKTNELLKSGYNVYDLGAGLEIRVEFSESEHPVLFEGNTLVYLSFIHELQNLVFSISRTELYLKSSS